MSVSSSSTPIWKGVRKTLASVAGTVQYTVKTETPNQVIFSGKATNRPGEATVSVQLFDILAPHLRQTIPDIYDYFWEDGKALFDTNYARRFILTKVGSGTTENIDVRASYGYDAAFDNVDCDPVRLELPYGAPLVGTRHYCSTGNVLLGAGDPGAGSYIRSLTNSTARPLNVIFDTMDDVSPGDIIFIHYPDDVDGPEYKVFARCGEAYVLYYVNAFGALDALWMKGLCRRTDSFEREAADTYRASLASADPDRRIVRIDTSVSWELNTGILTDAQARLFARHVPGTPAAYLLKLGADGGGWPVTIEASEVQSLGAATNGRRPVNYTLHVKLAQDRARL